MVRSFFSGFFSSDMIASILSSFKWPSALNFLSRWACESEGVACSLSMVSSKSVCSSGFSAAS